MTHTQTTLLDKQKDKIEDALGREQGRSSSSSQLCYDSYIYTISLVRSSEIKLHNREAAIEATGGARTPRRLYVPPTPHTECGGLLGLGQGCHHLPATFKTVGIVDIQQILANLDTMSTLVRDTVASRAEPPPSGWTDITLEQSCGYWSS